MKFQKSDLIKIPVFFLAGGLAFLSIRLHSDNTFSIAKSERISWTDAMILRDEYQGFKPLQVRYEKTTGDTVVETLNGFVFNAADLDQIINKNIIAKPDEVIFYLGQKGTFKTHWYEGKHGNMHIIAAGIKEKQLLYDRQYPSDATKSTIYDKADPCPPNCPN